MLGVRVEADRHAPELAGARRAGLGSRIKVVGDPVRRHTEVVRALCEAAMN
jgi:hypothetical protein